MIKKRAESGVQRIGNGSPMFKPGSILDAVRSADGSAVDIAFAYPKEWSVSEGPNLDVRNVRTSDSAFLLVAAIPAGETFEALPKKFFTDLLFRAEGIPFSKIVVDTKRFRWCSTSALVWPRNLPNLR